MKKILSNFVLSVFVLGQIASLTTYAEDSLEVKLDDSAASKVVASVETEDKTVFEKLSDEKVLTIDVEKKSIKDVNSELKEKFAEVKENQSDKELQLIEKVKELKEVKDLKELKDLKPVVIEKPIVIEKIVKCVRLPEPEGVIKSQIDYVSDAVAKKNVWVYKDRKNFDEEKGVCQWTCKEGYVVNDKENGCIKLESTETIGTEIPEGMKECLSQPKDSEGMIMTKINYYDPKNESLAGKELSWRYVSFEQFNNVKHVCTWTCDEKNGYKLNEENNGCISKVDPDVAEKKPCSNKPENTNGMIMTKIDYFNATIYDNVSWRYVPFKEFNSVKNACAWTCDEENGYKLSKDGTRCLNGKEHKVIYDPNCKDVSSKQCFGSVTEVADGGTYVLPDKMDVITHTLTYVSHDGTTTETRKAKLVGYYKNNEYLQKCEGTAKCGPAKIYNPGEKVVINDDVTFHALWESEDLNVTLKDTSSYRKGSYRYDFTVWNDSDSNTSYKAGETLRLLKDITLVAQYKSVYVGGNGGGNGGGNSGGGNGGNGGNNGNGSQDDVVVFPGQVEGCTVAGSTYSDEYNEAFLYACQNGITSLKDVNEAGLDEKMTRAEMAKFITQFALISLKRTPTDVNKDCSNFANSIASYSNEMKNYMVLACRFEYMGVHPNYSVLSDFMPSKNLSRAEFGTVLSRILWGNKYESSDANYYKNHLNALKKSGILKDSDPNVLETRGYVMLMLYRAAKDQGLIN